MQKAYERINWENDLTPLNEDNLNLMDAAVNELDNRIISIDTAKLGKTDASSMLTNFSLNTETGVITLTYYDGSKQTINTNLAKIALNISYDATNERLVLTMPDGSVTYVDMSALITQYEFVESDVAYFTVTSDGKVKVEIKDHSITADKLQPNFLADVQTASNSASKSASSALNSANSASASEVNAKESEEKAKMYAENASAVTGVQIATKDIAGLIKGGDNHIAEDGTLTLTARTNTGLLENSKAGGIRLRSITAVEDRQRTTTGAQLVESCEYIPTSANYGTLIRAIRADLKAGVEYTISVELSASSDTRAYWNNANGVIPTNTTFDVTKGSNRYSHTFTAKTNFEYSGEVWLSKVATNDSVQITASNLQIESGEVATDYEPYTGRKPSPAPGEKAVISTNQLEVKLSEETEDGITYSDNGNGGVEVSGDATADVRIVVGEVALKAGTYYAYNDYTDKGEVSADGSYTVYIYESDNLIDAIAFLDSVGETSFTLTEDKTVAYVLDILSNNYIDAVFYPMIATESGATWDVYEEGYTEGYPQAIDGTMMKNLLDCRGLPTLVKNGVTFAPVYDAEGNLLYVEANGTSTGRAQSALLTFKLDAGEYIYSQGFVGNSNGAISFISYTDDNGNSVIFDLLNCAEKRFKITKKTAFWGVCEIRISGVTCNNLKFYPMIRPASILDDTYVPYGCMRVVGKGKNLCGKLTKGKVLMYNTGTVVDGANYFCSDFVQVEYGKSYVISNASAGSENWYYDKNKKAIKSMGIDAASSYVRKITITNEDYAYIRCSGYLSMIDGFMIEEGTGKTDYTPYVEQSTILSQPFAEMHCINGVSDALTPYNEVRRFAKMRLLITDLDLWKSTGTNVDRYYRSLTAVLPNVDVSNRGKILCTHFRKGDGETVGTFMTNSAGYIGFAFAEKGASTKEEFKAWLDENEVYIVYPIVETVTPLPTVDQIALHSLKSFDGVTRLYTDTNPPMVIDCEYGTSKVGAEMYLALNKADANEIRYNELASAVLALNQE